MNPVSKIVTRAYDADVSRFWIGQGVAEPLARVVAARMAASGLDAGACCQPDWLSPPLASMPPPSALKGCDLAAEKIADVIEQGGTIAAICDYDCDGITSSLVFRKALLDYFGLPDDRLIHMIGLRATEGYGVSDALVDRMLVQGAPDLCVTADCGSSDEPRIARLAALGVPVVVTDHHAIPVDGPPASAVAFLNPQQQGCGYDPSIAGCMVAFLLMCRVRQVLLERAVLPASTPKLTELLPYVALGTVADCVSLATPVNRLVVQSGLKLMASSDSPAFRLIRERAGKPLDATFLAFRFGPLINAAQRVSDPHCSLEFLCATSEQEARARLEVLEGDNEQRKRVQREMMASALPLAADCFESSPHAVSVFLSDGHAGVQGIVASRLVERFGCPVAVMSPTDQPDVITGSARSIPDVDLKSVMDAIAASRPDCFLKYGGHAAAAGFSLHPEQIESFHTAFRSITESRNKKMVPGPELWTDGLIAPRDLQLSLVDGIESLGPWGRGWESPLFEGVFLLSGVRPVGRQHEHLSLEFTSDGQQWRGIWFDAGEAHADSLMPGILCRVVFEPQKNVWQGRVTLQLLVREMRPEREARPLLAEAGA